MAKTKKRNISDVKLSKPIQKKKQNPFEVHINREKFKVLGQKSKFDKGLPGVARAKAIKKRKETLLQEYKVLDKSNKFIDRRIGERNKAMTSEDKIIARFTAERMKSHKRKAMFNLAEEEVLTHKGRSITEVERFDDPRSDDEDEDVGRTGNLDASFVEEAHFGGGMFTKSKNNRESVIDQLIADSKKRKLERQQTREKTLELTEQLDSEWRDLIPIITTGHKRTEQDEELPNKGRGDSYDIALKELKFEARGKPSDKLKSEEEMAGEEAKRLRDLEEERLRRMKGEDTQITVTRKSHRSADALDDNFQLDNDEEFSLVYDQDGNLIPPKEPGGDNEDEEEGEAVITKSNPDDVDVSDEEEDEDDEEEEEEDEEDDDDINDLKTELSACNREEESDDESAEEVEETPTKRDKSDEYGSSQKKSKVDKSIKNTDNDSEIRSSLKSVDEKPVDESMKKKKRKCSESSLNNNRIESDISTELKKQDKVDNSEPDAGESKQDKKKKKVCFDHQVEEVKFGENASLKTKNKTTEEIRHDLLKRKELMDKARKQLPFTYDAPKSYEDLQELLKGHDQNEVIVIVERIIKCNHPKLREENKEKMISLFAFLMQYLNDVEDESCWVILDRLVPYLYDLMMFSPANVAECLTEILKEKQSDYAEKKHKYPSSSTMVFVKLVPLLFPASDKRHPVTTPALVFITQMLQNCKPNNRRSIASGLFLVTLIYEYVFLSKRICPQVLNFLAGVLHMASPASVKPSVVPPFKPQHKFLYLQKKYSQEIGDFKMKADELSSKACKIDDEFRIKSLYSCLSLLDLFLDLYEAHHASCLLFLPFTNYLDSFQVSKYPSIFSELLKRINTKLGSIFSQELEKVAVAIKKPRALRLYEPSVEPVYDTKKRKGVSVEKAENDKLVHKIRREKKGALREIRRDRAFLAKIKFKQQQKSDAERIRKVKEIYSWGAQQQGEINAFQRLKNKK